MDLYFDGSSLLHRLDPRTKLAFSLMASVLLLATGSFLLIVGWLMLAHALLWLARTPASRLRWAWGVVLPFCVMVPLLWPVFYQEGTATLLVLGPIRVTELSLLRGVSVALRIVGLAFLWFATLFTTDQNRLIRGLVRLKLPYSWGLTVAIALRYLPTLLATYTAVSEAQQARGLVLGEGGPISAAKSRLPILIAVMISALRSTDQLALALQARAFAPGRPRTNYHELRLTLLDGALLVAIVTAGGCYLAARLLFGFGVALL